MRRPTVDLSFVWEVSDAGYEWKTGFNSKLLLCERNVPNPRWRQYQPLSKTPTLFRNFADLCGKDDIRAFANRYGVLFNEYSLSDNVSRSGIYHSLRASSGTSIVSWAQEIADMAILLRIWDSIQAGCVKNLKNLISWRRGIKYRFITPKRTSWHTLAPAGTTHPFKENEILKPARYVLQRELN